jgi:Lar family restriction alleviation protein
MPLSKEELEEIQKLVEDGEFKADGYGFMVITCAELDEILARFLDKSISKDTEPKPVVTDTNKLLPCPFCNGNPAVFDNGSIPGWTYIKCNQCGIKGNYCRDSKRAIEEWNTRVTPKVSVEQVKGMIQEKIEVNKDIIRGCPYQLKDTMDLFEACRIELEGVLKEISEAENV